jgi:hypothetical protein
LPAYYESPIAISGFSVVRIPLTAAVVNARYAKIRGGQGSPPKIFKNSLAAKKESVLRGEKISFHDFWFQGTSPEHSP